MLCGINVPFETVSPARGHIIYALLTRLPLSIAASFDLHVLGTPPALVLSQDQTLHKNIYPSEPICISPDELHIVDHLIIARGIASP